MMNLQKKIRWNNACVNTEFVGKSELDSWFFSRNTSTRAAPVQYRCTKNRPLMSPRMLRRRSKRMYKYGSEFIFESLSWVRTLSLANFHYSSSKYENYFKILVPEWREQTVTSRRSPIRKWLRTPAAAPKTPPAQVTVFSWNVSNEKAVKSLYSTNSQIPIISKKTVQWLSDTSDGRTI